MQCTFVIGENNPHPGVSASAEGRNSKIRTRLAQVTELSGYLHPGAYKIFFMGE